MLKSYLMMPVILTKIIYDKAYYYLYPIPKGNIYINNNNNNHIYYSNSIIPNENNKTIQRIYLDNNTLYKYLYFLSNPTHIIDNIYLGSVYNSVDFDYLHNNNFGLIINLTTTSTPKFNSYFNYLHCPIEDNNKESIKSFLNPIYNYIINYQNNPNNINKKILIHCVMGASRSASVVIYYLIKKYKDDFIYSSALNYVYRKRPIVNITYQFYDDLTHLDIDKVIDSELDSV